MEILRAKSNQGRENSKFEIRGESVRVGAKTSTGDIEPGDSGVKITGRSENRRDYRKDCSILVNVGDNQAVKPLDIIKAVVKLCGPGQLYACVAKASNMYMLTLKSKTVTELISDGITFGDKVFPCTEVSKDSMVVSFMNVDPYVPDTEIEKKLDTLKVERVGKIRRLQYKDTDVENGNRICRVKLPKDVTSLPYIVKLSDGETTNNYRVIHDNQQKLCFRCNKPDHIFRDCPEFVCFRCNKQGHFRRQCTAVLCHECDSYKCTGHGEKEGNTCKKCEMTQNSCLCKCPDCKKKYIDCYCEIKYSDNEMSQGECSDDENTIDREKKEMETIFGDFVDMSGKVQKTSEIANEKDENKNEWKTVTSKKYGKKKEQMESDEKGPRKRSHGNGQSSNYSKMRILQEKTKTKTKTELEKEMGTKKDTESESESETEYESNNG